MWTNKRTAAFALVALATWACSPDDYPTASRFDPPPEEVEIPDGELFFYVPPAGVTVNSVSLRGQFNDWGETPMVQLLDGRWVAGVELEPGEYEYKYFFNGADWATSMCNDATYGDPDNGGKVDAEVEECTDGGNGIRQVGTPAPAGHTFLYLPRADRDVEVVTVAGSFQGWNNQTDTLLNVYEITVDLEPGTYQYKYVFNSGGWAQNMCDEGDWGNPDFGNAVDPDNDNCVDGGQDAEIVIEEAGPHTFRYIVPNQSELDTDSIAEIHLAGSFQGWNPDDDAYLFTETYQRTYELEAGTWMYKFIFDGDWANSMCTDTDEYGDPTTGLVDANNTDGCVEGGQDAVLIVE